MQYKFFVIPIPEAGTTEAELNRFLRGHRVTSVQRELIAHQGGHCWALCVEYLDGAGPGGEPARGKAARVDYKELLSPEDFVVFCRLRDKRKALAEAEAVPVYAVCTNDQLAEMARRHVDSLNAMRGIEGIGEAKAAKYGPALLAAMTEPEGHEAGGTPF